MTNLFLYLHDLYQDNKISQQIFISAETEDKNMFNFITPNMIKFTKQVNFFRLTVETSQNVARDVGNSR